MALGRLGRVMRQNVGGGSVTPTQRSLLFSIRRLQPVTAGDLASAEEVTPPSITRLLDRLERQALITREPHPTDRRVTLIKLTPAGAQECRRQLRDRDAWLAERLEVLQPRELEQLLQAVPLLERLCEPFAHQPEDDD
jgi:DNA-binding MarR family transcriptional regulator